MEQIFLIIIYKMSAFIMLCLECQTTSGALGHPPLCVGHQ